MAMAVAATFSSQAPHQTICSKQMAGLINSFPFKGTSHFKQKLMKLNHHGICVKNKPLANRKIVSSMSNSDFRLSPLSLSETIIQFYSCINKKKLKQLSAFISDDCCFEDCSFPKPFKGKKEVLHFFQQLTESMGQNVKFSIGHVCCGDEYTAAVDWHLEWKETQIPFTRGCTFYECSKQGERLIIKKAQAVIESPIKPGSLVLTLLKIVSSLFDDFPKAAEWFLKSYQVVLQWLLKMYTLVLLPIISPLLAGYINLWNFMAQLIGYALSILLYIAKHLFN